MLRTRGPAGAPARPRSLERFRLERYFAEHEFSVEVHLCASDCETLSIRELLAMEPGAEERFLESRLGYTESNGDPELRVEVATLYQTLEADDILIHGAGEEVILTLFAAGVGPGDRIAVHTPTYQSLTTLPRTFGADVLPIETSHEVGWAVTLADVELAIDAGASWVVLNVPHNPTGWLPTRTEFDEIGRLCREAGVRLVVDEVYRGLEFDPDDRLPCAADVDERFVSIGVMSKAWGLPGLRIGWLATRDSGLMRKVAAMKDYTTICSAGPSEFLATLALRHGDEIVGRHRARCAENSALLGEFIRRHDNRFEWVVPRAGSVAFPRLRHPRAGVEAFCDELRERAGILLLPGTLIERGSRAFRVGLGREGFAAGLEKLEAALG